MALPTLVLTGASGFVGRHLLESLAGEYRIFGIARRSQVRCGAPVHPNITWFQVDIGEREPLAEVFRMIRVLGGADTVVHLAAHYDFTGEEHPEYRRTNVEGLRNTLDFSRELGVKRFVFSSSVAACRLPSPGSALTEDSPPDGDHVYARTKAIGEAMVREYEDSFPSTIVRFAALFSDWCEYPPLFMFLSTWLSPAWNRNVLGGRGESAIPYLHVKDVVAALRLVLEKRPGELAPGEVLIASPDGSTSHRELFDEATRDYDGEARDPILMPRPLCGPGMWGRALLGRLTGDMPFERPWMARYIDLKMTIDASRTRARLGWAPRPRLELLRRLPFLIENLKTDPLEWNLQEPRRDEGGPLPLEPAAPPAPREVRGRRDLRLPRPPRRTARADPLRELPADLRGGARLEPPRRLRPPEEHGPHAGQGGPHLLLPAARDATLRAGLRRRRALRRAPRPEPRRPPRHPPGPAGEGDEAGAPRLRHGPPPPRLRRDPGGLRRADRRARAAGSDRRGQAATRDA